MNRRDAALALVALGTCAPMRGLTQVSKTYVIGIIYGSDEQTSKPTREALLAGLGDYGYVPGKNVVVHDRYSAGDPSRIAAMADELIALKVDLVLTFDAPAGVLRKKTTTLPIVLFNSADPVALGLIQSFARPGTNVTGMTAMWDQTIPKHIELLLEVEPKMSRLAVLYDDSIEQRLQEMNLQMAKKTAQAKDLTIVPMQWSKPDELREAFDSIKKARPDGLLLVPTYKASNFRRALAPEIRRLGVPSAHFIYHPPNFQETGALLGFGISLFKQFRRSIRYVDQILKGANPAELPVEQFGVFGLAVNLSVARELGIKIPPTIMVRAEEVVQ